MLKKIEVLNTKVSADNYNFALRKKVISGEEMNKNIIKMIENKEILLNDIISHDGKKYILKHNENYATKINDKNFFYVLQEVSDVYEKRNDSKFKGVSLR